MDTTQFAIFFVALLIGFALLFLRTRSTDVWLRELGRLRNAEERLEAIESSLRSLRSLPLVEVLNGIRDDLAEVAVRLERISVPPVATGDPRVIPRPNGERVRDQIEAKLFDMGYDTIHILSDLEDISPLEAVTVSVECRRDGIGHKGHLLIKNGAVIEAKLFTVLQAFP
jgi:hypothetical protein